MPDADLANHEEYLWKPLPVPLVKELLGGLSAPWWIAGGCAIDLFVGRQIRPHGDVDLLIRREDQLCIQEHLRDWDLHRATYPGLRPWRKGEYLAGIYRDIWCRPQSDAPWCLQIMLLDTDGDQWVFKRDPTIRGSLADIGRTTPDGIPYLAPEIQLLYKAKPETLEKDQLDFDAAAPLLANPARDWLLATLKKRFPQGHRWIGALESFGRSAT